MCNSLLPWVKEKSLFVVGFAFELNMKINYAKGCRHRVVQLIESMAVEESTLNSLH